MSSLIQHGKNVRGFRLAIGTLVVWLVLLGIMWAAFGEEQGGGFINFVARFHVLLVHIPIGIFVLVAVLEVLAFGKSEGAKAIQKVMPMILWITVWGTVMATLLGYLLMTVEGIAGWAMTLHLWTGIGVGVFAIAALIFKLLDKTAPYAISLVLGIISVSAAGHYGGAMVHEPEYMVEYAPKALHPLLYAGLTPKAGSEDGTAENGDAPADGEAEVEIPIEDRVAFTEFVLPVLEAKCTECHNANKIKGKLRMDTHELLLAGAEGSDFPTVIPGNAEESEMLVRVNLEPDDDEFMPPKGDALTEQETALLTWWVNSGASADATIGALNATDEDKAMLAAVEAALVSDADELIDEDIAAAPSLWDTYSPEEQAARMQKATEAAASYNFSLMPISAEDDRLRINVVNAAKDFGDAELKELEPVAERIVWLDLARSQVTDAGLKTIGGFTNLERLHLENTKVGDAGIAELGKLAKLEYLNLYGTQVSNDIFKTIEKMPKMKKLYVWQTKVDNSAARAYERSVNLEINTGYDLAAAAADAETPPKADPSEAVAKPEPKKEAPKPTPAKKPEPKKETPKPAPAKKPEPKKETPKPAPAKKPEPKKETPKPAPAKKTEPKKETPKPAAPVKKPDAPKETPKAPVKKEADKPKPTAKPAAEVKKADAPKPTPAPKAPEVKTPEAPKATPKVEAKKPDAA